MSLVLDIATVLLVVSGAFFFLAGTVGLLRFPDAFTRLHSLTKADNTGLGLLVLGLALQTGSVLLSLKMVFVWFLVLVSGAVAAHLISSTALAGGAKPWRKP
ncbi:MAG: cation:proton antiporter [Rubrobacter sp.]